MTPTRLRVVYVAGTGRSGSTLIAQYLERGTAGVHVGELRYVWERGILGDHLCECGVPFSRCPFWTEVLSRAYGDTVLEVAEQVRLLAPKIDRLRRIPQAYAGVGREFMSELRDYAELLVPLYRAAAAVAGTDLVIDSSKDPSYLYVLARFDQLEVLPLHLVRDPRAVAYSWTRRRARPEIHWEVQYMSTLRPEQSARYWLGYNLAIDALTTRSAHGTRVRYEDFARDPEAATTTMCAALGVAPMSAAVRARTGHSVSGNPIRFDHGPLVVRADMEWVQRLPKRDQLLVTSIALPLLRRYHYPIRTRGAQCAS